MGSGHGHAGSGRTRRTPGRGADAATRALSSLGRGRLLRLATLRLAPHRAVKGPSSSTDPVLRSLASGPRDPPAPRTPRTQPSAAPVLPSRPGRSGSRRRPVHLRSRGASRWPLGPGLRKWWSPRVRLNSQMRERGLRAAHPALPRRRDGRAPRGPRKGRRLGKGKTSLPGLQRAGRARETVFQEDPSSDARAREATGWMLVVRCITLAENGPWSSLASHGLPALEKAREGFPPRCFY